MNQQSLFASLPPARIKTPPRPALAPAKAITARRKLRGIPPVRLALKWIRIVRLGAGYMLTTERGLTLGTRLDRGRGNYPKCQTAGLSYDEAVKAAKEWERFRELNDDTSKKK